MEKSKLKAKDDFIASYEKAFDENGGIPQIAVILLYGKPIGVHTLTELLPENHAVFHAHIWDEQHRRQGVGVISYIKACDFFMHTLKLKKILFKTPLINRGAIRIKEKLGLEPKGSILFEAPILIKPLEANLYEIDSNTLEQLKRTRLPVTPPSG